MEHEGVASEAEGREMRTWKIAFWGFCVGIMLCSAPRDYKARGGWGIDVGFDIAVGLFALAQIDEFRRATREGR